MDFESSDDWAKRLLDRSAYVLAGPERSRLTLHMDDKRVLGFKPRNGSPARRTVVLTVPKSGTYLIAKFLSALGLVDLEIHAWLGGFSDYRNLAVGDKLRRTRQLSVELPIEFVASLVWEGQFFVGHLPYSWRTEPTLRDFGKILGLRDLRDCLVSYMRFERRRLLADPLRLPDSREWVTAGDEKEVMLGYMRTMGQELLKIASEMADWCALDGLTIVRFEELMGDLGENARRQSFGRIAAQAGLEVPSDLEQLIAKTIGSETLTYSGQRTVRSQYWSGKCEDLFVEFGGATLNAAFGY